MLRSLFIFHLIRLRSSGAHGPGQTEPSPLCAGLGPKILVLGSDLDFIFGPNIIWAGPGVN